ncbi:uncharacterized protein EAE97_000408 [Botrytis byssoidea]|uniref:Uncharacterized protein n=1 Tax=Botrytis byssoidea TaxID=139641 RepID=A0A9P5IY54_9HELO|nr:uncharacterized protein EAE97_000408 [Botrytis byssoidea]KAF7955149.1 hypothetical protein EAE97_000408 [Botrytis byssoidea]
MVEGTGQPTYSDPDATFRWLSNYFDDERYSLVSQIWSGHTNYLIANSTRLKVVNRDYCMIRPVGRKVWHTPIQSVRNGCTLDIFYSDAVIVDQNAFTVHDDIYNSDQSTFDQFQGFSRSHIQRLMNQKYNILYSSERQSSRMDWIPTARQYNVEVKPDKWEIRVAFFFGENFDASQICADTRRRRRNMVNREEKEVPIQRILGEKYLKLFQARWSTELLENTKTKVDILGNPNYSSKPAFLDHPEALRGRKRKSKLRQSLSQIPDRSPSQLSSSFPEGSQLLSSKVDFLDLPANPISFGRGRLKRRERRKNGNTCGKLEDKRRVNEPRILTIGETSNDSLDSNSTKYQYPDGAKASGLRITIRNLSTTSEDVKKVSYRVFSYCQLCDQHLKNDYQSGNNASYSPASLDPNITVGGQDFSLYDKATEIVLSRPNLLKQCSNHDVYICELRDESSILDENQNQKSLHKRIGVIEAEIFKILPTDLRLRENFSQCKDDDSGSVHLPDQYWPKFSMLIEKSWNVGGYRNLPHSSSYYSTHNSKLVIPHYRTKHGYLDPDNFSSDLYLNRFNPIDSCNLPSDLMEKCWRSGWTFNSWGSIMIQCDCPESQDYQHDVKFHEMVVVDYVNKHWIKGPSDGCVCNPRHEDLAKKRYEVGYTGVAWWL